MEKGQLKNKKVLLLFVLFVVYYLAIGAALTYKLGLDSILSSVGISVTIIGTLTCIIAFLGIFQWDWDMHWIYFVMGIGFGLCFLIVIPLYVVPDESSHMETAYALSNKLLGIKDTENLLHMRADDDAFSCWPYITLDNFKVYLERLFTPLQDGTIVTQSKEILGSPWYEHFLAAAGIAFGRLLHLNTTAMYLMGRLFALIGFTSIIALSIYFLPFGKIILFTLGMMPMTLQMGMSISYDTFVISVAILIISWTLRIFYSDKTETAIAPWEKYVLAFFCVIYFSAKEHAYFSVSLFPVFMYLIKKRPLTPGWRKAILSVPFVVFALIAIYGVVKKLFGIGDLVVEPVNYIEWAGDQGYTIQYVINHPVGFILTLGRTFLTFNTWYITTFVGRSLGWFSVDILEVFVYIYIILLLLSSIKRKETEQYLDKDAKLVMLYTFAVSVACIMAGLMLRHSPLGGGVIQGVQGRYFIPVAILFFMLFRSDTVVADRKLDKYQMLSFLIILMPIIANIMFAYQ